MSRVRIQERMGARYVLTLRFVFTAFFSAVLLWFGWNKLAAFPVSRTTLISSRDPIEVSSWDDQRKKLTVFSIPSDVIIEGTHGVGMLAIGSLARLEKMEGDRNGLLAKSLSTALGLPIREKGLPALVRLRYWIVVRFIKPEAVTTVDLGTLDVYRFETLPDGTKVRVFDVNRFDLIVGALLGIDVIRQEGLRVLVVNTTDVSGVGSRAARMVSHAGMVVVAVESESVAQQECTVHARRAYRSSASVRFFTGTFGCRIDEAGVDERSDITVRLGSAYASQFSR